MGIYLNSDVPLLVSYKDRAVVKSLGALPMYENGSFMYWYAPPNLDLEPLIPWLSDHFREILFPNGTPKTAAPKPVEKTPSVIEQAITPNPAPVASPSTKTSTDAERVGITLEKLLSGVKGVISNAFRERIWIRAEIVNISAAKPHAYLELSDYDSSGRDLAKARAMIWSRDLNIVRRFEEKTGISLKSGVKILCQVNVEFSEKFGLSLKIVNIDESFTLGDMEAKVQGIKNSLIKEGVYGLNRQLPEPVDYTRIAVIAPEEAAGLGDFMTQARLLMQHQLCDFVVFAAKFQGNKGVSIINAFASIERLIGKGEQFDAIVVIRGGGDKAGIYELNEHALVRAVCTSSLPVIVGVGHERDVTLLDEVCSIRCATPSLVISHIVSKICTNAQQARASINRLNALSTEALQRARLSCERLGGQLTALSSERLQRARLTCQRLESQLGALSMERLQRAKLICQKLESRLGSEASQVLGLARRQVDSSHQQVISATQHKILVARELVSGLTLRVVTSNPSKIIDRGYAYVMNEEGAVVGDGQKIPAGTRFTVQMRDGQFNAIKEQK